DVIVADCLVLPCKDAKSHVIRPGGIVEQGQVADGGVVHSGCVVRECFVPERIVGARGGDCAGKRFKPNSRTEVTGPDTAECTKSYSGIGAAGNIGEEGVSTDGGVGTHFINSASAKGTARSVTLQRTGAHGCVAGWRSVGKQSGSSNPCFHRS